MHPTKQPENPDLDSCLQKIIRQTDHP